jgi:glycosyltransferase involved in cell wall biosynthesis
VATTAVQPVQNAAAQFSNRPWRLLYVLPGLVPPPGNRKADQFLHLPPALSGDILLPTWGKTAEEIAKAVEPGSYPEHRVGNFKYHLFLGGRYPLDSFRLKALTFWFFLRKGLRLSKQQKFDCIWVYGWTLTGLAGLLLARLTGSKLIVHIPGIPENAYQFNRYGDAYANPKRNLLTAIAKRISDLLLHVVLRNADCAHLLYSEQLNAYPKLGRVRRYITHSFVPVSQIPVTGVNDGSVLLVGAPWYVKGVDILIQAFRMIEAEFPATRLKLLGHYPGQDFQTWIGDSQQIEVMKARSHPEALEVIANCGIFVLASRTEALGRVLLEAMAAGKPVIAPKLGGIPHYVQEGVNGLLFERENVADLARQLRRLLISPELQARLGRNGQQLARTQYNETALGESILAMVQKTVSGECAATLAAGDHRPGTVSGLAQ